MVMQAKKSIGEVLVERGAITEGQLQDAREVQKVTPGDLGGIIQDLDIASEKDVDIGPCGDAGAEVRGPRAK